ncbi:hypothetical protein K402DRAFT_397755 [Aulographum hederae CBS 113979]|uniref:RTA1 domain protein n=1 Tax=Aulographum hederae CBS 113979 TaxID=1176131 RepID=A0A6G1GMW7_9PEZI|nr:hypothetical protein K402DRAFT_397755 [Aulographum hederae CBS 113979]
MGEYVEGSAWYYAPIKNASIVFAVLFVLSGLVHAYQTYHYKSHRITFLLPWAGLMMSAGFAVREAGAYNYDDVGIIIATTILIMSGPPVYAIIDYLVLGRCLYYIPYLSPIHPGRVITTFLGVDFIVEALIGVGAGRVFNSTESNEFRNVGQQIVKSALIIQAVMFLLFIALTAWFHVKAIRAGVMTKNLRTVLIVLYISATVITVRCIYRIVEFFEGYEGTLYTSEEYFWVFEAAIMWANTAMLNIWHPAKYLPRDYKTYLAQDGITELRGPGWKDERPFLQTFFDPFDVVGLITGSDKKTRFWEMPPEEWQAQQAREREEKEARAALPRPLWKTLLDPFHLYGYGGVFEKSKRASREKRKQKKAEKAAQASVETGEEVERPVQFKHTTNHRAEEVPV